MRESWPRVVYVLGVLALGLLVMNGWTYLRLRRAEERVRKLEAGALTLEARIQELAQERPPSASPGAAALAEPTHPAPGIQQPTEIAETVDASDTETTAPGPGTDEDYVPLEEIRRFIDEALEEHFRDLQLSEQERRDLADAVFAFREAQAQLRQLTYTQENADQFRHLQAQREAGWQAFKRITNMTPAEFMRRVDPGGGISNGKPEEGPIVFEYMDDFRP